MPIETGTRLGPYEMLTPIGAGGMGEVWKARDTRLDRDVAVKILPEEVAADAERRSRFEREARAIAALNHPNIVALYDVGDSFVVMELLEGTPLRALIGKLSLRRALDIAAHVARGLAAAHEKGIVHRDLKPENIFVLADGRAKILDFGLVKWTGPNELQATAMTGLTEQGAIMGTVNYMSPEQLKGDAVDHRTDIFSLGLVLYEMATGQAPFSAENYIGVMHAILYQPVAAPAPPFPEALWAIIDRTLAKDPGHRYQTAGELRDALAGYLKRAE